ncbi:methylmalonyl-CoA mutase [Egicoccus sp. AB-alg6-2]|uniref:acyl-CoA mutase large subunit family protein n=1 Tax=Egicoccus sp. AB-alg6-2 TaxID=3242692 RepID=UPI00359DAB19
MSWQEQYERWKAAYEGAGERDADFETLSGIPLEPLYGPHNVQVDAERIGAPGVYPYTRGVYASMYRTRPWTIRQFAGFADPTETNKRFHDLVRGGQHGLSVAFDMPTLMGLDSDDPRSEGEVGHCGVAIDTVADMDALFHGLPLGEITTSMTINAPAVTLFCMYAVAAERQGFSLSELGGTLQTDILKEYIAQKEWLFPPEPHLRLIGDLVEFCTREVPRYHPVSISGYHIREAGSTAVQELAYTLADGFAYVELGMQRGLHPDEFVPRFSFFFDAHIDFFEEIAKFRAGRRIWARWLKERYGATAEKAMLMRFHTQTAGVSLTAQQPDNNIVRTAIEALAGVLGGTQSLHTNALDEVLALPSDHAAKVALRTQQVIAEETGVTNVIDPLGGSWYVEWLTDEIERRCEEEFTRILELSDDDTMLGGILRGVEDGYFTSEIADAAFAFQNRMEKGRFRMVGVNAHTDDDDDELEILRIGAEVERGQVDRLQAVKRDRDPHLLEAAMQRLRAAADTDENMVPLIMDAVRADATVGEISAVLQDVWGTYSETPRL